MTTRKKAGRILHLSINLLVGLAVVAPILYGLSISLMTDGDIFSYPPKLIPPRVTFENYRLAVSTVPIFQFMANSTLVSVTVTCVQLLTASLAAFAFAFFEFRFKKVLFIAVLATMMIPGEATIMSNYLTMSSVGLLDTYIALILPYMASAMSIFMVRQFYLTVPKELKEAALLDGCGDLRFFGHILMPLSGPVLGALSIYNFIGVWNQYMWPMLVTNTPVKRTVQIGISMLKFSDGLSVGLVNAGCMIILIPTIALFVFGQQKMVQSITAGAVKG